MRVLSTCIALLAYILHRSLPDKTSSSAFAHMATELVNVTRMPAVPHFGNQVSQLLTFGRLKKFLMDAAPTLAVTYMASTFDKRSQAGDVSGLMRTHDYDADVLGMQYICVCVFIIYYMYVCVFNILYYMCDICVYVCALCFTHYLPF